MLIQKEFAGPERRENVVNNGLLWLLSAIPSVLHKSKTDAS